MLWICTDWQIDWTAIAAVIALFAAGWAVAFEIRRERKATRDRLDQAAVLSVPFHHELTMIAGVCRMIEDGIDGAPSPLAGIRIIPVGLSQMHFPMLQQSVERLQVYDTRTAAKLAKAVSGALQTKSNAPPPDGIEQAPEDFQALMSKAAHGQLRELRRTAVLARRAIEPLLARVATVDSAQFVDDEEGLDLPPRDGAQLRAAPWWAPAWRARLNAGIG